MSSALDDLFEHIINSERQAQERKNQLHEIKTKIRLTETAILELKQEKDSLLEEMTNKIKTLNQEEVTLKLLNNRKEILSSQKLDYDNQRQELETKLENLEEELFSLDENFCTDVQTFITEFGLHGNGHLVRKEARQQELENLIKEKYDLEKTIQHYEDCQSSVEKLKRRESTLKELLNKTQRKHTDMCIVYEEEKQKLANSEQEKVRVQTLPSTDTEFIRLQTELEDIKGEDLEGQCHKLQEEVQSLQQQLWQKNIKARQQQRNQSKQQQATVVHNAKKTTQEDETPCPSTTNRVYVTNFSKKVTDNMTEKSLEEIFEDDPINMDDVPEDTSGQPVEKNRLFRKV